jgi:hypothetical protein
MIKADPTCHVRLSYFAIKRFLSGVSEEAPAKITEAPQLATRTPHNQFREEDISSVFIPDTGRSHLPYQWLPLKLRRGLCAHWPHPQCRLHVKVAPRASPRNQT